MNCLDRHLAKRGIPCPAPLADTQGKLFNTLHGKPAALVSRLSGYYCLENKARLERESAI